jgi:sodium transport system permease protein
MRWSIVRLIWLREMRDQLRDRRTVFMIVVLPLLLYPILGFGVVQFTMGFVTRQSVVGVRGAGHLPPAPSAPPAATPARAAVWVAAPAGPGALDSVLGALARDHVEGLIADGGHPPLLAPHDGDFRFAGTLFEFPQEAVTIAVRSLDGGGEGEAPPASVEDVDRRPLDEKQVDLILFVPPDFAERLAKGERPAVHILSREGDDRSRMLNARVHGLLARWKNRVKEVRLLRSGLPANYDDPFEIDNPERAKPAATKMAEGLFEMLVRIFPFMLVMWSLAGALYPAVDVCAGEKERGTMETLLITPASREEIVGGKFLTIWVFSAATALLNLASMGISTWLLGEMLPPDVLRPAPLVWCVVLVVPLSAFFGALCLAVGAYARSSKEGQYYLMPLFLVSMPLIFLTLAPGVELNAFYSMVPITGVALLLQELMTAGSADEVPWLYFLPVLAPMVLYSWLALRWAIEQFKREEVLFREAERLDVGLWLRRLFRDKEPTPSTAMALFCFAVVLVLRWLSFGFGPTLGLLSRSAIGLVAFMAAPPLFMALLLTTRPRLSLALRRPTGGQVLAGAALAVLLLLPLMGLTQFVLSHYPALKDLLRQHHPLTEALEQMQDGGQAGGLAYLRSVGVYLLVLGFLPAVCEELAFRGFILTGLLRRFRPGTAIVLSSFLFALAHLNVFQFLPSFVLGLVLGVLAVRSGSVLPGMVFHLLHNGLLIGLTALAGLEGTPERLPSTPAVAFMLEALCIVLAALVLWRLVRPAGPRPLPAGAPSECQEAACS